MTDINAIKIPETRPESMGPDAYQLMKDRTLKMLALTTPDLCFTVSPYGEHIGTAWTCEAANLPSAAQRREIEQREFRKYFDQDGSLDIAALRVAKSYIEPIQRKAEKAFNTAFDAYDAEASRMPDGLNFRIQRANSHDESCPLMVYPIKEHQTTKSEIEDLSSAWEKAGFTIGAVISPLYRKINGKAKPGWLIEAERYLAADKALCEKHNLETLGKESDDAFNTYFDVENGILLADARTPDDVALKIDALRHYLPDELQPMENLALGSLAADLHRLTVTSKPKKKAKAA